MIVAPCGGGFRLGNRLEMFLHLGAFSHRAGVPVAIPSFAGHAEDFAGTRRNPFCLFPRRESFRWLPPLAAHTLAWLPTRLPSLAAALDGVCLDCPNDREFDLASADFLDLARSRRFVFLRTGWQYRDWDALPDFLPVARKYFHPAAPVERAARAVVEAARRKADIVVGVHVRRTDFRDHLGGRYFFSIESYAARMKEIAASAGSRRVAFVVCSDEPRHPGEFPGLEVVCSGLPATGDLAALSFCDAVTGPAISSFSGWAALMGDRPFLGLEPEAPAASLAAFGPSPLLKR